MGKKIKTNGTENSKALIEVNKHYNKKKGIIKVPGNKKKEKMERALCCHAFFTKKGNLRPTLIKDTDDDGSAILRCEACGQYFHPKMLTKKQVNHLVKDLKDYNNNIKYIAVRYGAGPKVVDFFANVSAMMLNYAKLANRVTKMAKKTKSFKNKKKDQAARSNPGDWSRIRRR